MACSAIHSKSKNRSNRGHGNYECHRGVGEHNNLEIDTGHTLCYITALFANKSKIQRGQMSRRFTGQPLRPNVALARQPSVRYRPAERYRH